ncbi:MAG TPA: Ig-like domain-containing protein [Flavobacteriaceae bacterium]|nr:Ig-like domain-containing protein [Flavobacteriaceae bacterium]
MRSAFSISSQFLYFLSVVLILLLFTDCAKKGTPSGGPRDTIPPVMLRSSPENYSTHLKGSEIEIRFDEYIKLKDLQTELVISPPLKNNPFITPLNTSKVLKIKINDTLAPNTTYVFNFGNSITDNNEGNVYKDFKYVFSTGDYIDSLKLKGRIKDAEKAVPEFPVTVMLYEINEKYTDSIIFSEKPRYVTGTKDTTGIFEFTNLKAGRYRIAALREKTRNYLYNPKEDKIGFLQEEVRVPTDTTLTISLFKEALEYKAGKGSLVAKHHVIFGYTGAEDSIQIRMLNDKPVDFSEVFFKDEQKDTIHYWYKPMVNADTLVFSMKHKERVDTVKVRFKELYRDSLNISMMHSGTLKLKDTVKFRVSVPIASTDSSKVSVMTSDSVLVKNRFYINTKMNVAEIYFDKKEEKEYKLLLEPGAITDFFGRENDSLQVGIRTRSFSDYGSLRLTLENVNQEKMPIIVQLVDDKYAVVAEDYLTELREVYFDELLPNKYLLRIILDSNKNRRWDSGNYLKGLLPEKVIYYPRKLDVRANWSLNEKFRLK